MSPVTTLFSVSITADAESGEHRARITAPAREIAKLAASIRGAGTAESLAEQLGTTWAGRDALSVAESRGAALLRLLWRADNLGSNVAGQVFVALNHERAAHLVEHPDCPNRGDNWPG